MPRKMITDEALICFVRWCRTNAAELVENPTIARRVFEAYRLVPASAAADDDG